MLHCGIRQHNANIYCLNWIVKWCCIMLLNWLWNWCRNAAIMMKNAYKIVYIFITHLFIIFTLWPDTWHSLQPSPRKLLMPSVILSQFSVLLCNDWPICLSPNWVKYVLLIIPISGSKGPFITKYSLGLAEVWTHLATVASFLFLMEMQYIQL